MTRTAIFRVGRLSSIGLWPGVHAVPNGACAGYRGKKQNAECVSIPHTRRLFSGLVPFVFFIFEFPQPIRLILRAWLHPSQIRIFVAGARGRIGFALFGFGPALFFFFLSFGLRLLSGSLVRSRSRCFRHEYFLQVRSRLRDKRRAYHAAYGNYGTIGLVRSTDSCDPSINSGA